DNLGAYRGRGIALMNTGRLPDAIKDFDEVVRLAPNNGQSYRSRGDAYFHSRQSEKAIADFTQAITLDPNDFEAYNNRGAAHREIEDCEKALSLQRDNVNALDSRAWANLRLHEYNKAIADYNVVLERDGKRAFAFFARGVAKQEIKDEPGSLADLEKARELD